MFGWVKSIFGIEEKKDSGSGDNLHDSTSWITTPSNLTNTYTSSTTISTASTPGMTNISSGSTLPQQNPFYSGYWINPVTAVNAIYGTNPYDYSITVRGEHKLFTSQEEMDHYLTKYVNGLKFDKKMEELLNEES